MWTVQRVKDELPPIAVKIDGRFYDGILCGRFERFCTIFVKMPHFGPIRFEYAWSTIARLLNEDSYIRYN